MKRHNFVVSRLAPCLLAAATLAMLASAAQAESPSYAIVGATVHVRPGTILKNATLVIRNGRIAAVGTSATIPSGAERIDGRGKIVTAGFIEAMSNLGLSEVGAVSSTVDGQFDSSSNEGVHAAYRASDGLNHHSIRIPIARSGGVTSAVATPGGGLVAGTSTLLSLAQDASALGTTDLAMYATLGQAARRSSHGSRGFAIERLRELLDDARQYARRRSSYERNQTRAFAAGRLDLAALGPVIGGKLPLVIRAHRASDIAAALRIAKEFKARIIIAGGAEAWMLAAELAAAKVPVILNPIENLPRSFDRTQIREDAAAVLARAGVVVAISTLKDGSAARTLRQLAGNAIARGMSPNAALAALTSGPAQIFGLRNRGVIARGNIADVVIWSGDPFELSSRAEEVFVGGVRQSNQSHQTQLFRRYRTLQKR